MERIEAICAAACATAAAAAGTVGTARTGTVADRGPDTTAGRAAEAARETPLPALSGASPGAVGAVAVALEHIESGYRWGRLADQAFTAASLIKLPILAATYEAAAKGRLGLGDPIGWEVEDQVPGDGVIRELTPGGALPLRDLLTLMIVVSDNSATNLVLGRVGIAAVNDFCRRYGLTGTHLLRPLMVVPVGAGGANRVTAADMVRLLAGMARGEVVSREASRRMVELLKRQQVRDGIPALLPGRSGERPLGSLPPWEVANKTGEIAGHRHDAGLIFLPGQCFALAVLTRGLPSEAARLIIARIARAAYDEFAARADHAGGT